MNNIVELTPKESRADQASLWLAKLDRHLSADEIDALRLWLAAHPDNRSTLLELAVLWDKMSSMERLSYLFPESALGLNRNSKRRFVKVAAALVLFIGLSTLGVHTWNTIYPAIAGVIYQTDVGGRSNVTLADGTKMMLNTNSMVIVRYTSEARSLILERGEVFVEVAKDEARPLSVSAGEEVVQAVGTAFNVAINSDRHIELMVLEGRVKAGAREAPSLPDIVSGSAGSVISGKTVTAGQALLLGSRDEEITSVSMEEMGVKLSWRNGNLVFRGESLEDAIREVERYTSVDLVLMDEPLKHIRVAGLFRAGDVDGLLATLKQNFNIDYHYAEGNKVELRLQP